MDAGASAADGAASAERAGRRGRCGGRWHARAAALANSHSGWWLALGGPWGRLRLCAFDIRSEEGSNSNVLQCHASRPGSMLLSQKKRRAKETLYIAL